MRWWQSLPPSIREPLKSYLVSASLSVQSIVVAMMTAGFIDGKAGSPGDAVQYFQTHWWAGFLGLVFGVGPYYRARQGAVKVTTDQATKDAKETL